MDFDFSNTFNTVMYYLTSPEIQAKILPWKITFLAISVVFLIGLIILFLNTNYLRLLFFQDLTEFFTRRQFGAKRITGAWNKILRRLERATEPEYKLAAIEADDMLDNSLKRMGYGGQNLEERLKKITAVTVPNIAEVLEAHQTRNAIVRDPDYRLSLDEARRILDIYAQAFRHLQILG